MNKRRVNIQRYNAIRSGRVQGMINLISDIDDGCEGIVVFGVYDSDKLKHQINSYRAMKIAQYFGRNISKSKLVIFSKPTGHHYDLSASDVMDYISEHHDAFMDYWQWYEFTAEAQAIDEFFIQQEEEQMKKGF